MVVAAAAHAAAMLLPMLLLLLDIFILSLRLSILAFSNWRWFEEKSRADTKTSFFIFWNSWLGWVGLGWDGLGDMFILSVRLSILAFSN